jgi:hypothetical protein
VVIGHGYFSGETALGCEVRILVGASPAVTACSLTQSLYLGVDETVPEQNSARGDVRGNFVACRKSFAGGERGEILHAN